MRAQPRTRPSNACLVTSIARSSADESPSPSSDSAATASTGGGVGRRGGEQRLELRLPRVDLSEFALPCGDLLVCLDHFAQVADPAADVGRERADPHAALLGALEEFL